ncbi:alpha/beta hydrolase fold domain-containing protein [Actinomycetes bacterium KLBMP 9797]
MPLDPDFRERFAPFAGVEFADLLRDQALRTRYEEAFTKRAGYRAPAVDTTDVLIDGPAGPLRLRVYEPRDPSGDVVVWVHGGGFVAGSIDMVEADVVSRELCRRARSRVVSVDYQVAGAGIAYPVLHREVVAAYRWARAGAARLTLAGASAGGNLALAATLEMRASGDELPARLGLIYPALHRQLPPLTGVDGEVDALPPPLRFDEGRIDAMFAAYLGGTDHAPYASADGHDLTGLPPCLVVVNEYDDLRPSGERFAADAIAAGVDVDLVHVPGMPHGHLNMTPLVPQTAATLDRLAAFAAGG